GVDVGALFARTGHRPDTALLSTYQPLQCLVRVCDGRCDADARRLFEEEGKPLGSPRRRALVHVSRIDGAEALREPGAAGRRSAAGRMGLPRFALQSAGAVAYVLAQLPESLPCGVHAVLHFPSRTNLSRSARSPQ